MNRTRRQWLMGSLAGLQVLAGCAPGPAADASSAAPLFSLPPASLGRQLAWRQQLVAEVAERPLPPLEVLLQCDDAELLVALVGAGRTLGRLRWDGLQLRAEWPPTWPERLAAERMLSDLQLALWPLAPLQAALPPGWSLDDADAVRQLRQGDRVVATVIGAQGLHLRLQHHRDGYHLRIDSIDLDAPDVA